MSASTETSGIADFFKRKSIFITGATGFIGKQLVEKLVRSCPDIEHIYLLVRPKRGHNVNDRMKELLASPLFNIARSINPNFEQKITALQGDILDPNFGLNATDEYTLIENCHVVFHSAATVRFHEPLRLAVQMNVASVKKLLFLCHKMKKLQSIVHVSTAYANCNRSDVAEMIYPPPIHPSKLLDASEWMDDQVFDAITAKVISDRPNTYTFTKALAEYVISQESKDLPLAIIRPSIVGSSWREPMPGWIDNYNGPSGMLVATSKGMLRTMLGNSTATADIVPVDVCVNMMIAIAWHTAIKQPKNIPIYHCCTGHLGTLTWGKAVEYGLQHLDTICMENAITFPHLQFTENRFRYFYLRLFQELVPAFILDCYMRIIGRKPIFAKLSDKIYKSVRTLDFFTSHSWIFPNDNSILLQNEMTDVDQRIFNFDLKDLDWFQYWRNYCLGTKQYLLREDLAHMSKCHQRNQRLKRFQNFLWFTAVALILKFFFFRSFKFHRIIFLFLRSILSILSTITNKIGFHRLLL
jgi:fatty acyl-CoA reductase